MIKRQQAINKEHLQHIARLEKLADRFTFTATLPGKATTFFNPSLKDRSEPDQDLQNYENKYGN